METIVPTLEAHLGYWLRCVSNRVSGEFARALQARHASVAEWVVLCYIRELPERKPGEIARALGLTRGAISKVLDKLETKTWITRAAMPEDNRAQQLSLTPQGRRILPVLTKIADRNDEHFFGRLDAGEQITLRQLLRKLADFHRISEMPVE